MGSVTMTTEVGTDGATTLSRMNLSGYVGHVIFSSMCTIACCLVVGLGLGLGLGLDLVLLCTRICATLGCHCHGPLLMGPVCLIS